MEVQGVLEKVNLKKMVTREEYRAQVEGLKERLSVLQQEMKQCKLPVIVLFEGWGAAGKGSVISNVILNLDPRGFKVYSTIPATEEEKRKPMLWRYWNKIPAQGDFSIFDRSWYQEIGIAQMEWGVKRQEIPQRLESIRTFERQLTDDGYLIIKFFLHISKKEQKKRFEELAEGKTTSWRVTQKDWKQNKHYDDYYEVFDRMLISTDSDYAPWHLVGCQDKRSALLEIYSILADRIHQGILQRRRQLEQREEEPDEITVSPEFNLVKMPKLSQVRLDQNIPEEEYRQTLKEVQKKLSKLHNKLYQKKIPVIICYEGWDAAGKGGNIKRVAAALDPRGYEVLPIAAPDKTELSHHYLWRFWNRLPKTGHIAIFDRTWYGRVMVERLEGFCTNEEWRRAYQEINEFEKELSDWGAIIVKFWIHIDKDEQLRRFEDRQNTPSKQWKITEEDWRNREKWDQYEVAVNDMLRYTSTDFAPWHIIESQDKRFARIKAIKTLIHEIEERLD